MQQLSGLDATFVYLETPEMPMHVGALQVLELPPGFKGKFATALRKHIASRLPLMPALRRRLWWMPLNMANPAWVDADPDLRQHVVEVRLPAAARHGNGQAELEAAVSQLHPVLLDRQRPLWKFHVLEGLAPATNGNRRVALYSQLHHAAVDGQAAVALANMLFDLTPQPRTLPLRASRRTKTFRLETVEMLRGVLGNQAQKVAAIVRALPSHAGTLKDAATRMLTGSPLLGGKAGSGNLALAPRTSLNTSVGATRAFASVSLPLAEVKALGRAFDATVNDIVLMLCSSALRRHFSRQRLLPRKSLIAAVPVSLREAGDETADNQASMSLVNLGTNIADPARRLAHIRHASGAMKSTMGQLRSVLPTDFPSLGVPWLMEAATALYGKVKAADRIPQLANLVISNVPGPQQTLYLAGARLLSMHPTSIVVHGLALNITVQSYDGSLDFGLMADAAAMPDVHDLAGAIAVAFDDLRLLPRPGDPAHDGAPAGLVGAAGKAARSLAGGLTGAVTSAMTGAVGKVARKVVDTAVESAVSQVMRKPRSAVHAKARRT